VPIEPSPSRWALPQAADADDGEVAGVGADLEPGTLLAAYRRGLFPMRLAPGGPLGWWSPSPRGILPLDGLQVSRSLRRSTRRFAVTVDTAFEAVMRACADRRRDGGWIDEAFVEAYSELHRLGWAHSVEVWTAGSTTGDDVDNDLGGSSGLVGGIYGVAIGGLFAGESMFHTVTDASKVALVALVDLLRTGGGTLFDVQWCTPHLASLGVITITRAEYAERLADAIARPQLTLDGYQSSSV
jgi:leucyl/phenylalanyl-tRNA---protein transferase